MTEEEVNALAKELGDNINSETFLELMMESSPPISLTAYMDFSSFTSDQSYVKYANECIRLGAKIEPLDVLIVVTGNQSFLKAAEAFTKNGFDINVDVQMDSVPVCMTSACDEETDLTIIVDKLLGDFL